MYSMSTETLETVGHFGGNKISFLPLASQVLYEFIEEGSSISLKTCGPQINFKWQDIYNGGKRRVWVASLSNRRSVPLQPISCRTTRSQLHATP